MKFKILTTCLFLVSANLWAAERGCFFKSDCPTGKKCVIAKGEARGVCQEDFFSESLAQKEIQEENPGAVSCRYHSECGKAEMCVKADGAVLGVCRKDPLAEEFDGQTSEFPTQTDHSRCNFNTDCKTGSSCVKEFGQLTGTCQEPSILEEEQEEEKSIFDKPRVRRTCLQDSDCGLRGMCVRVQTSVWGECRDKTNPQLLAP